MMSRANRRPFGRVLPAAVGALVALWFAVPLDAWAEESASDVEMMDEAWFFKYRQPLKASPVEPPGDEGGPISIAEAELRNVTGELYPGAFTRVGANLGEDEARAYLTLPLEQLGDGLPPVVTGGTITLVAAPVEPEEPPEEVDPEAEDASDAAAPEQRNVESADMVACLTEGFLGSSDTAGDWEDQPEYTCDVRSPLEAVEGAERPTWTVDLGPFVDAWADPMANQGVTIVPNPERAEEPDQSWHVAFPTAFNALTGPSPLADLTYEPEDVDFDFDDDEDFDEDFDSGDDDLGADGDEDGSTGGTDGGGFDDGAGFDDEGFDDGGTDGDGFDEGFDGGGSGGSSRGFGGADGDSGDAPVPDAADDEDDTEPVATAAGPDDGPPEEAFDAEPAGVRTNPAVFALPLLALGLAGLLGYSLTQDPELGAGRKGAVSKLMERRRTQGRSA